MEQLSILLKIIQEQGPSHWTDKMRLGSAALPDTEKSFDRYHTLYKISEKKQTASALCHPIGYPLRGKEYVLTLRDGIVK